MKRLLKKIPLNKIRQNQLSLFQKVVVMRCYADESRLQERQNLNNMYHMFRDFHMLLDIYADRHQKMEIASKRHMHFAIQDHNQMISSLIFFQSLKKKHIELHQGKNMQKLIFQKMKVATRLIFF